MEKSKNLEAVKKENVKFIHLHFIDITGALKSTAIPAEHLEDVLENGRGFDGSSILGYTPIHESDMLLMPDPSTFAIIPWSSEKSARIICDIYLPGGKRFEGDPRYVAQRAAEKAREMGYIYNCGPELEFFVFRKESENATPLMMDHGGYFDFHPLDLAEDVRKEMILVLESLGLTVEMSHHEVAPSQYEVDFKFGDLVTTADRVITYKMVAKTIAHLHGYIATFMPKPLFGENGSGMHTHQSLWKIKKNRNVFFDPSMKRSDALSEEALYFIGGLLYHAKALAAVVAPTVNSYKRLVPGYEAPVYISWAHKNRSALIRVPEYYPGMEKAMRAEFRCPDPASNPYLAFACMCAAGLDGIEKKILPPEPIEADIYEMNAKEREEKGIDSLPSTLIDALNELRKDEVLKEALGRHVYENFMKVKLNEWDEFRIHVTEWEIKKYMKYC
ncbi:MAG: type I glutamate--ammonia ligase [Candidatus Hydrothermarchaeota archaeon]|nr:type I glutamate--ammonia ligase [Candidatus Hydrothermarchaeota archaeon]